MINRESFRYKYIFRNHYINVTWWRKDMSSWDFLWAEKLISLGRLFIEWDWKGNLK